MPQSKVLVVEDHPMSRRMLESMLKKTYDVISAASGAEAIAAARRDKPDLVLLDIEMPGMDGFQTLEVLKREVIEHAVPVIFLTAREDSESREQGLQAGAVDYLTKPYDRHELSIKVKNHLALYEARKEIEARNRVMAREMEMASQLQTAILPQELPQKDRISLDVLYKPLSRAGGDFYDVIEFQDGSIGFAQVDVSGHGVASAMIGAMFKMIFQSYARGTASPAELLARINDEMFLVLPDSDFLTVFYAIVHPDSLELTYTNAGHPLPFLHRAATGEIMELGAGGPLVGAFPGMEYDEETVQLAGGDRLLVFTDGVPETRRNRSGEEFFGEGRLKDLFVQGLNVSAKELLSRVLEELEEFNGRGTFEDDITLLLATIR